MSDPEVTRALLALAREGRGEDAQLAVEALGHVREAGPAVVDALFALLEGDAALRRAAGYALGRLGPATLAASDRLLGVAAADDVAGEWARAAIGELGEPILPALERRLEAEADPARRARLAAALGELRETKAPVPTLRRLLEDGDVRVRVAAALAIGRLGEYGRDAVPALEEATGAPEARVRLAAVTALGMLGRGDRRLVAPLAARVADEDGDVARAAVDAIGRLALPETIDTFLPLLEHEDAGIRWRAAHWLGTLGATARRALPALMPLLEDPDEIVRQSAARAAELIRKGGR
ncbi:MAG: HEAT repeat domain-containing protein [Planctomycetota bacterium]